ncbi:MAG TPA: DUF881 domain-containing protein [Firmicutes bacterium]|nr:DUF881 domain-containing protein [Bacillota bacterium]HOQ24817.1 DUF881 domain-containing protein [Bacillota bacterium]HPT68085.1 DUF881 domain-containing protein [Bacillota bacterium]
MKIRSWQVGIGLVAMVLSMLLVFQLRTESSIRKNLPTRNVAALADLFYKQNVNLKKMEDEIIALRRQLREYDRHEEMTRLRNFSGLSPVKGPGIVVRLDDAKRKLKEYEDPNFFIVHYDQLELLVNELWAAGAEAIAIGSGDERDHRNFQRVVTTTGFSCAGTTILVDTKRLAPPYIIRAIGNPRNLKTALTLPGGFLETQILSFELDLSIEEKEELYIPPYKGSLVFNYAEVCDEDDGEEDEEQ